MGAVPTVGGSDGTWGTELNAHLAVEHDATDGTHKAVTVTSITIAADGATVTGIKDEDDMAADSAVKLATQQSIKAYVDSRLDFGTRTANDSTPTALAATSIYKVGSDGFVTFTTVQGGAVQVVEFKSDSGGTPSTVLVHSHGDWGAASLSHCIPVVKDDYWQITVAGGASVTNIKWLPIGSGTCVKQ